MNETRPILLTPAIKDIIWGGTRLSTEYHKADSPIRIAETWELSLHPDGRSLIAKGEDRGKDLTCLPGIDEAFPTLIKLIDACQDLSVQVHPAKTEMWYVMDCEPGARLVYGLKDAFDPITFRAALEEGKVEALLNYVEVKKGDVFFIPSGLVHAIGKGILIAEIQQSSNVTYRVYDYGRLQNGKPRALHVEQALSVIRDFTEQELDQIRFSLRPQREDSELAACPYFCTSLLSASTPIDLPIEEGWQCILITEGSGRIGDQPFKAGDTYFRPSASEPLAILPEREVTLLLTSLS